MAIRDLILIMSVLTACQCSNNITAGINANQSSRYQNIGSTDNLSSHQQYYDTQINSSDDSQTYWNRRQCPKAPLLINCYKTLPHTTPQTLPEFKHYCNLYQTKFKRCVDIVRPLHIPGDCISTIVDDKKTDYFCDSIIHDKENFTMFRCGRRLMFSLLAKTPIRCTSENIFKRLTNLLIDATNWAECYYDHIPTRICMMRHDYQYFLRLKECSR